MKAAIVEKPGELVVREVPQPEPGEYEALCEFLYGATCTGTDQHIIHDRLPWQTNYPAILGHESIGRVVETGPKVRFLEKGDLVVRGGCPGFPELGISSSWGGFAQYGLAADHRAMQEDGLPENEWMSHRRELVVPPDIDPAAATMMITWRETLSYFTRMGVSEGANVWVLGSGGVGLAFTSHARNRGAARVVATGNPTREEVARAAGASDYFGYGSEELADGLAQASPEGFDFVIDSVGKADLLETILPLLKPGGAVGIYGIDEKNSIRMDPFRARGTFTFFSGGYDEYESHDEVVARMRDGSLDATLWLDLENSFPLVRIGEAFDAVRDRKLVKALVRLTEADGA